MSPAKKLWLYSGLSLTLAIGMSVGGDYASLEDPDGFLVSILPSLAAWSFGIGMVVLTFWLHFLACRMTYREFIIAEPLRPQNILFAVLSLSAMQMGQMALWGVAMYLGDVWMHLGELTGDTDGAFIDYLNFSMATYTSLGLGDITPTAWLKVLTGMEALTGLLCIGWSASLFVGKMGRALEAPDTEP